MPENEIGLPKLTPHDTICRIPMGEDPDYDNVFEFDTDEAARLVHDLKKDFIRHVTTVA